MVAAVFACCDGDTSLPVSGTSESTVYSSPATLSASATSVHDDTTTSVPSRSMATGRKAAGSQRSPRLPIVNFWRNDRAGPSVGRPDRHLVARGPQGPLPPALGVEAIERRDPPVVGAVGGDGEELRVVGLVELRAHVDERRNAGAVVRPGVAPPLVVGEPEDRFVARAGEDGRDRDADGERGDPEQHRGRQPVAS